jgi:proteasome accessory factor C
MSDATATQLNRIVQLVAELSRREREGREFASMSELASRFGVSTAQIDRDIRTLTVVKDDPDHEWLSSLLVLQEGDAIALSSRGHFRRPVRLTPDEAAAIQIGLAMDGRGRSLSAELARLLKAGAAAAESWQPSESLGAGAAAVAGLGARAAIERRCLDLEYAGSDGAVTSRVVEVHRVVEFEGRSYLVAWCRLARGRRSFRADRVLSTRLSDETFADRPDGEVTDPDEVFQAPRESPDRVTVRFSPRVARWLTERYPEAEREEGGSVVVTYEVSDVHWLVRTVLQYGAEAEVLGPEAYREAVRRAVAA